jgi:hypothetical protein
VPTFPGIVVIDPRRGVPSNRLGPGQTSVVLKENNYVVRELYWGSFSRRLELPEEVDPDAEVAEPELIDEKEGQIVEDTEN